MSISACHNTHGSLSSLPRDEAVDLARDLIDVAVPTHYALDRERTGTARDQPVLTPRIVPGSTHFLFGLNFNRHSKSKQKYVSPSTHSTFILAFALEINKTYDLSQIPKLLISIPGNVIT